MADKKSSPVGGFCPTCKFVVKGDINRESLKRDMKCMWGPPESVPGMDPKSGVIIPVGTLRPPVHDTEWCWRYERAPAVLDG